MARERDTCPTQSTTRAHTHNTQPANRGATATAHGGELVGGLTVLRAAACDRGVPATPRKDHTPLAPPGALIAAIVGVVC